MTNFPLFVITIFFVIAVLFIERARTIKVYSKENEELKAAHAKENEELKAAHAKDLQTLLNNIYLAHNALGECITLMINPHAVTPDNQQGTKNTAIITKKDLKELYEKYTKYKPLA